MNIEKAKIYGVDGVGKSNPTLERTDDAIGQTISIGEKEIQSSFDKCYPWSDMKTVTDSAGNVFVQIPKFYVKRTPNQNGTEKWQISGLRYDGFMTPFVDGKGNEIDYVRVGAYEGSGSSTKIFSVPNADVCVNITMNNFRQGCRANGEGYQQYDFLIDWILKYLFTIEFATTNTQSIMKGFTNSSNTAAIQTGRTDLLKTASGSETSNTDGYSACKYRGIENPWGNTWTFVDGISFGATTTEGVNSGVYLCEDPTGYEAGKTTAPYRYVAERPMSKNWIKSINSFDKNPILGYTNNVSGASDNTYFTDYFYVQNGGQILLVGGAWPYGPWAGLWYWNGDSAASFSYSDIGGRLCYKPL